MTISPFIFIGIILLTVIVTAALTAFWLRRRFGESVPLPPHVVAPDQEEASVHSRQTFLRPDFRPVKLAFGGSEQILIRNWITSRTVSTKSGKSSEKKQFRIFSNHLQTETASMFAAFSPDCDRAPPAWQRGYAVFCRSRSPTSSTFSSSACSFAARFLISASARRLTSKSSSPRSRSFLSCLF